MKNIPRQTGSIFISLAVLLASNLGAYPAFAAAADSGRAPRETGSVRVMPAAMPGLGQGTFARDLGSTGVPMASRVPAVPQDQADVKAAPVAPLMESNVTAAAQAPSASLVLSLASDGAAMAEDVNNSGPSAELGSQQGKIVFDKADQRARADDLGVPVQALGSVAKAPAALGRALQRADEVKVGRAGIAGSIERGAPNGGAWTALASAAKAMVSNLRGSLSLIKLLASPGKPLRTVLAGAVALGLLMSGCGPKDRNYTTTTVITTPAPAYFPTAVDVAPGAVIATVPDPSNDLVLKITAPNSGELHLHVNMVLGVEFKAKIVDYYGNVLDTSFGNTFPNDDPSVSARVSAGDIVYAIIGNGNGAGVGARMDAQAALPSTTPGFAAGAVILNNGPYQSIIPSSSDQLVFRVDAQNSGLLSFRVNGVPDVQFDLRIYDSDGFEVASDLSTLPGDGASAGVSAEPAKTFYITVDNPLNQRAGQPVTVEVTQP